MHKKAILKYTYIEKKIYIYIYCFQPAPWNMHACMFQWNKMQVRPGDQPSRSSRSCCMHAGRVGCCSMLLQYTQQPLQGWYQLRSHCETCAARNCSGIYLIYVYISLGLYSPKKRRQISTKWIRSKHLRMSLLCTDSDLWQRFTKCGPSKHSSMSLFCTCSDLWQTSTKCVPSKLSRMSLFCTCSDPGKRRQSAFLPSIQVCRCLAHAATSGKCPLNSFLPSIQGCRWFAHAANP